MKHKNLTLFLLVACTLAEWHSALALDGFYVGAEVGSRFSFTGSTNITHGTAIGFGLDLGTRVNPMVDLILQSQMSSHSKDVTLFSEVISADLHIFSLNDFEVSIGAGPGFYFFKTSLSTETDFGLNGGANIDLNIDDHLRAGISGRYHGVFSPTVGGSLWSIMMRVGYFFSAG